jgi:hypothetical protein
MVGLNARDAARKTNAPKAILKGSLRARKHGRQKVWLAQWWENGSRRTKILGRYSEISKAEAHVMLTQIVQPLNQDAGAGPNPAIQLQAIRGRQISSRVSPHVEGIDSNHLGTGHFALSRARVREAAAGSDYAGTDAKVS